MSESFYWHDYETFGTDPSRDRPVQFAGLRTDAELKPIGSPLVLFAKPADDFLPQPGACLVTGISPQQALREGVPECEFIDQIHRQLAQPGTCGVGYNSLRFDDEVTRYTLYRNFHDPYARESRNGNSRWDIIDLLRTAHALRPEGIKWPLREDGLTSFKLEELTAANGIEHAGAHDALADVEATIAMARLVKQRQPKLYDYLLRNRGRDAALAQLNIAAMKPVLHVSGMFGAQRHNSGLIVPLAQHPVSRNEIICFDLNASPDVIFQHDADQIRELLFSPAQTLPEGAERPGLKTVHLNRCPVLLTAKMLDAATAERLDISSKRCREHLGMLREMRDRDPSAFAKKVQAVYSGRSFPAVTDPDRMLYGGAFFGADDKRLLAQVRASDAEQLAGASFPFADPRLSEMLFRYRARNFPQSLTQQERAQWEEYRFSRLTDPDAGASICMEEYQQIIEQLLASPELGVGDKALLESLLEYADQLLA